METADRQQVGKTRIAHCLLIVLGNGASIAAGERRRDGAGGVVQPIADMSGQFALDRGDGESGVGSGLDEFDLADD